MENVMRRRMITMLASAVLAASLLATGAQARGGGAGGGGHMGGFGGGHIGGLGAGSMAHVGQEHFGIGSHRFDSGIYDPVGPDCPNDTPYPTPYTCTL
jgi:hypothetical protein